ncbi:MAG: 4Fe-4S binding protein [Oscillospiraceae bacterium]|jgi:Fe-S-cluster-containing hydrogenase component 2|nr:4Fe-4S binding protein [Oscillospiraceae bacterium]
MPEGVVYTGIPSREELAACPGIPTEARMARGRVAVIECVQEIPCNPCESACRFGAIEIGEQLTALPRLDGEKCTGCGLCVALCPGLAITIVDKSFSATESTVDFPFEYLPLPGEGDTVDACSRAGETVCPARVVAVKKSPAYAGTAVVSIRVPTAFADEVRTMRRLPRREEDI